MTGKLSAAAHCLVHVPDGSSQLPVGGVVDVVVQDNQCTHTGVLLAVQQAWGLYVERGRGRGGEGRGGEGEGDGMICVSHTDAGSN